MSDLSLINLGELTKPATVLLEKIAEAIGGFYRPHQIKRVASAEAAAEIIRAGAEIEVSELQRRALQRVAYEEGNRQSNIEAISAQALPELNPDAKPEDIEPDWLTHFFDRARLTSDKDMQSLWGRILAGQANAPGAFARRTIEAVATLEKSDAETFTKLCGFAFTFDSTWAPIVFDENDSIYIESGIGFPQMSHLAAIGLITFNPMAGFAMTGFSNSRVEYYGVGFRKSDESDDVPVGRCLLTRVGAELAPICGSEAVEGFVDYVLEQWLKQGFIPPPFDAPPVADR